MIDLLWKGLLPEPARARVLAARGYRAVRRVPSRDAGTSPAAEDARPVVVRTADARKAPAAPHAGPWIWVCDGSPGERSLIEATMRGAYDVVSLKASDASGRLASRLDELMVPAPAQIDPAPLVTASAAARRVAAQAARVAPTSMPVLLTGETGTGKEIVARLLHKWSPRRDHAFIPVNCAAIPNDLMEAELFGYAQGAFSGAVRRYDGQLAAASGGTVFLDEVDDTPLSLQVKLLRVLEDRVVSRLGENVWREVDFRILAATNRDLEALVAADRFGADLYERLAIVTIQLQPLRERLDDVPALVDHFIARFFKDEPGVRCTVDSIRSDALRLLQAYPWPGNIRELRNVVFETLVYKRAGHQIIPADLPRRVLERGAARQPQGVVDRAAVARRIEAGAMNLRDEVRRLEHAAVQAALARTKGNAAEAARLLGAVGRGSARDPGGTLRAMMRRLERDRLLQ